MAAAAAGIGAWAGPAIAGGAAIVGDLISSSGGASSNWKNIFLQGQAEQFNEGAMLNQQAFSAEQAALNRNFQGLSQKEAQIFDTQMQRESERYNSEMFARAQDYNTMMSNTAMQRRVADLKAAGLNPLLAPGAGGASAPTMYGPTVGNPTIGALPGSMPGSSAASVGASSVNNPNQAFGNLGQQTAAAMALKSQSAQIENTQANTKLQTAQTPTNKGDVTYDADGTPNFAVPGGPGHQLGDAQVDNLAAQTGLNKEMAKQVGANTAFIVAQTRTQDIQTAISNINAYIAGQNASILQATKQAVIQQALSEGVKAGKTIDVMQGTWGSIITAINSALPAVNTAVRAATPLGRIP